ncbi:Hypothetical_protein [Hexamita inflata]|uniref:Hypothetical_protein n=1 Tax=Hexamita inflata TaxID=28002 RepID=A0AA86TDQ2_9EUKA|nr:Hypothetical protein HINF_LOCUS2565 [Hexamita inflata]
MPLQPKNTCICPHPDIYKCLTDFCCSYTFQVYKNQQRCEQAYLFKINVLPRKDIQQQICAVFNSYFLPQSVKNSERQTLKITKLLIGWCARYHSFDRFGEENCQERPKN